MARPRVAWNGDRKMMLWVQRENTTTEPKTEPEMLRNLMNQIVNLICTQNQEVHRMYDEMSERGRLYLIAWCVANKIVTSDLQWNFAELSKHPDATWRMFDQQPTPAEVCDVV